MISVVIPTYNSASLLKKNLPRLVRLLRAARRNYEIIVSDDASTDDTRGVLDNLSRLDYLSSLKVIVAKKNRGFASTVDTGIRAARGEVVFILKADVLPQSPEYFRLMMEHFEKDTGRRVFAVSAAQRTMERGRREVRGQGEIYFERGFFLHRRPTNNLIINNSGLVSAWADGGACALRRDLYLKLGGFDPLYNPFYWEDVDLGYRARRAGYTIRYEPRAVLLHAREQGAIRRHYSARQIKIISRRNQFIFVWENGSWGHLLRYALWEPYHALIALKNRDGDWFTAYWQAVLRLPVIVSRRFRLPFFRS